MSSRSLWDLLTSPGASSALHTWRENRFVASTWEDCVAEARRRASALRRLGAAPGDTIGLVLTNSVEAATSLVGAWFAGLRVASLPVPSRGMAPDDYTAQIVRICAELGTTVLLAEERLSPLLDAGVRSGPRLVTYESLHSAEAIEPTPLDEDEAVFIQYSSGSTARPTGCVLTARAIRHQLEMIVDRGEFSASDRGVTWLPLSHDMGLFGALLMPWVVGGEQVMSRPERFLTSPRSWMKDCAELRATWTLGPNFGVAIAARAAQRARVAHPTALRYWVIGSDPIQADTLEAALAALGRSGLARTAFAPAYGLAEATLAVTMTPRGEGPSALSVDRAALLEGELVEQDSDEVETTLVVACGTAVRGVEIRIAGDSSIGEICLRSPSLARGYIANPEKEQERFQDGELRTGDLGFVRDDLLYVVGRKDDMLSLGGRNVYATDLEAAFTNEPGVRKGGCVLVDVPTEQGRRLVVLIEPSDRTPDYKQLADSVQRLAANRGGVGISECMFVPRGTLPKTPTGKVQRFACRQLIAGRGLETLETVEF